MQVGFRKNNITRQNKTRRETKAERNCVGANLGCNIKVAVYVHRLPMQHIVYCQELYKNVQNSICSAAGEVAESLRRYETGKGFVKKINGPYNDMSYCPEQRVKLAAKVVEMPKYINWI